MSNDFFKSSILPHQGIIVKICRAYTDTEEDFEDYYQEVCLQIWRSKEKFRGDSKWSTWIYRLTLNCCLTLVKKKKNNRQNNPSNFEQKEIGEENNVFENESLNMLYDAIKQLSEIDRAIILLYLEEKPYDIIAEIIGTSSNNIAVRIKRVKEKLKKLLDGKIN